MVKKVFWLFYQYPFLNFGDQGPPWEQPNGGTGDCGNGWVCEHRWKAIGNMGYFRGSVHGTNVEKWNNGGD